LTINAEAASTVNNTAKKNNNDFSNVISVIDHADAASTVGNTKKTNNDHNNIVSTIDTDAASTNNNEEPSDYNVETDDSVNADSND